MHLQLKSENLDVTDHLGGLGVDGGGGVTDY
jgi:hypothetical protein